MEVTKENQSTVTAANPKTAAYVIGGNNANGEVTVLDSEFALLDNVLIRDDPEVIYMQQDVGFYDSYYLSEVRIDDDLLAEARKIRRIYRNYTKYMYACYIREKYLSCIEEKYKLDTVLKYTGSETIVIPRDVFIPPYPIYSKNAEDYEKVMNGNYLPDEDTEFEMPSTEEIEELMDSLLSYTGRDTMDISSVPGGIETYRPVLEFYDNDDISHSSRYSHPSSVSITDLDALQKMIRSWHKKEEADEEQTRARIPFPKSEEGVRQQYMDELAYYIADHIDDANKEPDENEMVYDEVTRKPMTRKELQRRKFLRMLSEDCGWDMVKLMSQLNVGSKMERKILRNKKKNKKKAKKKAADIMSSLMGTSVDYDDNQSMTVSELSSYLFGDER